MPTARKLPKRKWILSAFVASAAFVFLHIPAAPALALSELPAAEGVAQPEDPASPDIEAAPADEAQSAEEGLMEGDEPDTLIEKVTPLVDKITGADQATAEASHDIASLPAPVARMRELIMDAASKGDLKAVAALMNPGPDQTFIGIDDTGNDLETALKDMSGDPKGMEILAIMLDVLATGYVHIDPENGEEAYVWPYFVRANINALTPAEEVELMRIVTAGDYAGMLEFGGYNFYRIGILPDGQWRFFVAGD